jgi:putative IMPACT (imprinted ancient) family translation regulator
VAAECLRQAAKREDVPMVRVGFEVPFEHANTLFHLLAGLERELEEYTEHGLRIVLSLEESRYPALAKALRDATRGKASIQTLS